VVTGGGVPDMPGALADGHWVQPTIWTGLPETAHRARGDLRPVLPHRPLRHRRRGHRAGQRHRYGLATTVWTQNLATAHRMAREIEVGLCWINSWFLRDLRTAFGGAKQSGIGREGGVHSLEFYTELRNVMVKL
jgi:aminomuconate-semialdehyde/2-hydroxymuconate-6-semialdehyde dehydrogenase